MTTTPPGWYPDTQVPNGERWWDGAQWTEDRRPVAMPSAPPQAPASVSSAGRSASIAGLVASGVVALGSLLPWATLTTVFGSISVSGTEGDGVITLVLAVIAASMFGLVLQGRPGKALVIVALLIGALVTVTAIADMVNVSDSADELGNDSLAVASIGIGLYITLLGSIGMVGSAVAGLRGRKSA